jgi:hypothetical protein
LAAVFFAAFFLAAIIITSFAFLRPYRLLAATHRASPRSLNDEVLRDVGGCAKWVAHSRRFGRLCGGNHESHRHTGCLDTGLARIRQGVDKIFFREVSGEMLRMRDLHHGDGPLEGPSTHRMRALRNYLVRGVSRSCRGQDFASMVGATACRGAQLSALLRLH